MTFSQQAFADSLKLPYPLLSDTPGAKVMKSYGIFNEEWLFANRAFFLIDPQGILRKKWIIENQALEVGQQHGETTVVYSDTLLRDIRAVMGKR